jgi:hypothetical protein
VTVTLNHINHTRTQFVHFHSCLHLSCMNHPLKINVDSEYKTHIHSLNDSSEKGHIPRTLFPRTFTSSQAFTYSTHIHEFTSIHMRMHTLTQTQTRHVERDRHSRRDRHRHICRRHGHRHRHRHRYRYRYRYVHTNAHTCRTKEKLLVPSEDSIFTDIRLYVCVCARDRNN